MAISPVAMRSESAPRPMSRPGAIRVFVIDDSALMCRTLTGILSEDLAIQVVGSAQNGTAALEQISSVRPDVVTLDIEMPMLSGLDVLQQIRTSFPSIRVVMLSHLTKRGAPTTIKALMLGASDYVAKPSSGTTAHESREYLRRELVMRIRQFLPPYPEPAVNRSGGIAVFTGSAQCVVIGVSTGGPHALATTLSALPASFPLPILIVQHMPALFTTLLAERLAAMSRIRVEQASHGQVVQPGVALLAPGGFHMRLKREGGEAKVALDEEPPEHSCRPAVDVLFRSAAEIWGGQVIAAVLTGMGRDGLNGVQALKSRGAWVVAQDQASSAVWGMPGSVVNAGLADEVLELSRIPSAILKKAGCRP